MLLVEEELITESKKENQHWFIEGIFAQSEIVNKNNRLYREEILDREMKRFINEYVSKNRAVGELSHPDNSQINPDRVAILIESLEKQGTEYYGRAKVLDTPCGKIIQAMIEGGVVLGVSTRGSGTVKQTKKGYDEVNDDYTLYTIDAVLNPSAPKALVNAVYEDSKILDTIVQDNLLYEEFYVFLKERKKAKQIANRTRREEAMIKSVKNLLSQFIK